MTTAEAPTELAAKINRLFDVMRKPSDPPLSNAAAAEAITQATGTSISSAYLWQLRSGLKSNPTVVHLRAIAQFFGVPASYLIDAGPDEEIESQLSMLQAMKDAGVRNLALRASGLAPRTLAGIAAIVDRAREVENLPPIDPPEGS
ncbi:helix-turn-helix domain-containing protein [Nocardia sp. CDC159]|uniref:Helix-turn-helix domain-containing protein n=1 Tax=Nocardia pulmonis TaxID=2951408 RepID=A0A9X2J157_9NOCA|nr:MULTISPECIES: helix-turn-helix domain-containing protein [Nocardia]MCM6778554.1 helix-turn-helix domain-containing protein [Nocardia pulmonis]MCM6791443.1 helix-turn-helix domain-containing protein [Nocardia sp. CDC159]